MAGRDDIARTGGGSGLSVGRIVIDLGCSTVTACPAATTILCERFLEAVDRYVHHPDPGQLGLRPVGNHGVKCGICDPCRAAQGRWTSPSAGGDDGPAARLIAGPHCLPRRRLQRQRRAADRHSRPHPRNESQE